jgi:hypothetical protein
MHATNLVAYLVACHKESTFSAVFLHILPSPQSTVRWPQRPMPPGKCYRIDIGLQIRATLGVVAKPSPNDSSTFCSNQYFQYRLCRPLPSSYRYFAHAYHAATHHAQLESPVFESRHDDISPSGSDQSQHGSTWQAPSPTTVGLNGESIPHVEIIQAQLRRLDFFVPSRMAHSSHLSPASRI